MANGVRSCTSLPSLVLCMLLAAVLEFCRGFNTKNVFNGLEAAYRGMADAFAGVVMLLVAAGVFAQGLSTIGFINGLISIATSFGSASIILMLVLVILTMLAAMTTGSGNAPFYAFVEMIPKLAHSSGINPAYLSIPMLQASNLWPNHFSGLRRRGRRGRYGKNFAVRSGETHLCPGTGWFISGYYRHRSPRSR
ncbi:C4-dicarboxylate transporter DcuC [Klebsiella oxytoca]|nr:C4-dicarboxylate transporter DcuC [Klebsiella oxytoca]